MSSIPATSPLESSSAKPTHSLDCCNNTVIKITVLVVGLLLISAAVAAYFYQINTIAVCTMGTVGGLLILGSAVSLIIQCRVERELEEVNQEIEQQQKIRDDEAHWHWLAQTGNVAAFEEAIKDGPLQQPVLLLKDAALSGQAALVAWLLQYGADPRQTALLDSLGYSALHLAATCHDHQMGLDTMLVLLEQDPTLVSVTAHEGITALHLVVTGGLNENPQIHQEKVDLLIRNGASAIAADDKKNTPLHQAVYGVSFGLEPPNLEVIEILVADGAQWDTQNSSGQTPLQILKTRHPVWCKKPEIANRLSL